MNATRLQRVSPDIALACASLIAAVSVSRLLGGGLSGPSPGPLLATAAVGAGLPALLASRRVPLPIRVSTGTLAVALVSLWTTVPGSTSFGLPTGRTWHALRTNLHAAHPILVAFALPLRATEGIVLLAALVTGLVAVMASVLLHSSHRRGHPRPVLALLAPFGLLAFVAAESSRPSLALPLAAFVAAGALTVAATQPVPLLSRSSGSPPRPVWFSPALGLTAVVMIGVVATALTLGGSGSGAVGSQAAGGVPGLVPPTDLSLTSSLVALEVNDANVVLFRAKSLQPTYWQVAVLNTLRHGVWVAGPGPTTDVTPTEKQDNPNAFSSTVTMAQLSSRLLPVPPSTINVREAGPTVHTSEGIEAARRTVPGERYLALSAQPNGNLESLTFLVGRTPVSSYPQALVHAEVGLPALPASIAALAKEAIAGASTPLGQAEALVNWFRSGRFRYTLDPPPPAAGADPLVSFLTQTRAGTCEQFAGAFTVLARSLGLPTRLVVGFTAGRRSAPNEVTVTGADAHAWPQVYLGADVGWISFEPTPQQATGQVAPEGVVGPTTTPTIPPSTTVTQPTPTTTPTTPITVPPTTVAPSVRGSHPASHTATPERHNFWWVLILLASLLVMATIAGLSLGSRRRRRSPRGRSPDEISELAESDLTRSLTRAGVARPPWQPLPVLVADLAAGLDADVSFERPEMVDQLRSLVRDASFVASTAERARYDATPIDPARALAAHEAALRVRKGLRSRELRQLLLGLSGGDAPVVRPPESPLIRRF
jgi:transglutaminase-like putative cysteine protease